MVNSGRDEGVGDDEVSVISSRQAKKFYKGSFLDPSAKRQSGKEGWHSDITFEPVRPSTLISPWNSSAVTKNSRKPIGAK